LVISPASTLHNWQQEVAKFAPQLKTLPYWGSIKDRKTLRKFWSSKKLYSRDAPFHVLITSYQIVVADQQYFQRIKWQYMVLDEAHAIKSSSTARWKTLLKFNCRNRLLLTGTPVQNSMQELWALLHFIMPTFFDSHEEFSEWFSKDIESHATEKGTLNEHQLRRLHMILKPFMLRRIKRDVEHELGEKIEKTVYCELTARQRRMYDALSERISIDELLEKATLDDRDIEEGDALMNLVMHFRKVCNHPQLFEIAEVQSATIFSDISHCLALNPREPDVFSVTDNLRNPIQYQIPKSLFRLFYSGFRQDSYWVRNQLSVWTADRIHQSEREDSAFRFLPWIDLTPGEASFIARSNMIFRWIFHLQQCLLRARLDLYAYAFDDSSVSEMDTVDRRGRLLLPSFLSDHSATSTLLHCVEEPRRDLIRSLAPIPSAYLPTVVAPPVQYLCSDRLFAYRQETLLHDPIISACLYRNPTRLPRKERPLIEVLDDRGMLPPNLPHISQAPIWVPNPRQLMFESGKLQALDRLLQQLKTGNHRVLLYFQMTKMIDLMEEYLAFRHYTYLRLDGSSKISDRRDMVMDWQTRSDIFIFLLSTRAGGLGINLTAADTVVFYDSDWNPTVDQQAMDRAHRLGQTRQVTVYRLITRGTIEERILQRAMEKDEIQKVVISGGAFNQEVKNENDPGTEVKAAPMPVDSAADMEIDPLPIRK
jgi:DNA helicase INO80